MRASKTYHHPYISDIPLTTRPLNATETRLLQKLKKTKEKKLKEGFRYHYILIMAIIGPLCAWLASLTTIDILVFLLGTIAVFMIFGALYMPYLWYKDKRQLKSALKELNGYLATGIVNTYVIHAKRIAIAKEYEDEGDLFIIEYDTGKILYLWDVEHEIRNKLPVCNFEIYEYRFSLVLLRQVYPLSEKIKAVTIDPKAKWNYMRKPGIPEHMHTETANFDALVRSINGDL